MGFITDIITNISAFRITIGNKLNTIKAWIGNLPSLTTTYKTDLVGAINEVNGKANNSSLRSWNTTLKYNTWSRLLVADTSASGVSGVSYILNVKSTRGGFVVNFTFLITCTHAGGANAGNITQLSGNKYSVFKIRIVSNGFSNHYIEVFDDYNTGDAYFTYTATILKTDESALFNVYTIFNDGTTVPNGYHIDKSFQTIYRGVASEMFATQDFGSAEDWWGAVQSLVNKVEKSGDIMSGPLLFSNYTNQPNNVLAGIFGNGQPHAGNGKPATTLLLGDLDFIGIEKVGVFYKKLKFWGNDGSIEFPDGSYTVATSMQIPNVSNYFEKASIASSLNVNNFDLGLFTVIPTTLNLPEASYGVVYAYKANTSWWFQQFKTTNGPIYERRAVDPINVDNWSPWIKTNANSSIDNYAPITYVDNKVASIPTPNNGSFVVQGVGALQGTGTTSANTSNNTVATLDLTQATKNDIIVGKTAYTWGDHSIAGYASTTYVNQQIAAIAVPSNGSFVVQGVGSLQGAGTTSANATANTIATLDLTQAAKNDIAVGVNAGNTLQNWGVELLQLAGPSNHIKPQVKQTIVWMADWGMNFDVEDGVMEGDQLSFCYAGTTAEYVLNGNIMAMNLNKNSLFWWSTQHNMWIQAI